MEQILSQRVEGEQPCKVVALAGNPNVGKSTIFNGLTGLHQHTGNWHGKTVSNAYGHCTTGAYQYTVVDLPGTYSLVSHYGEEQQAQEFLCSGQADVVVVVCDATCLQRNLQLVLQIMEMVPEVVVCVNLLDEAEKRGIHIDLQRLATILAVPVVGMVARKKDQLAHLMQVVDDVAAHRVHIQQSLRLAYDSTIERAVAMVETVVATQVSEKNCRWLSLQLLAQQEVERQRCCDIYGLDTNLLLAALQQADTFLAEQGGGPQERQQGMLGTIIKKAEEIAAEVVICDKQPYQQLDGKIDRIVTSRWLGYPLMLALLAMVFWLTIVGANIPSELLAQALFAIQQWLTALCQYGQVPWWIHDPLVLGVYRVLAWVVAVMLPPMAIFFPLFALLEDCGYLPRIAYNLDRCFRRCGGCGKQPLVMSMGLGCNAAAVVGCRIIHSPRERLLAVLTNSFMPCNGRFPTLIVMITMFFVSGVGVLGQGILAAMMLSGLILFGIVMTFVVNGILSHTLLKGKASSFILELPSYRKPQFGQVLLRSVLDRTLFVLQRAVIVAIPAGLILWLLANITVGEMSLLAHCADFLDPFARVLGLDGVILLAFLLGWPANEIVLPIMIMAYLAQGSLLELDSVAEMKQLLVANGWTWVTALCTMLFSMMHWPCATTVLTIKKETDSWKWAALAVVIPTVAGMLLCFVCASMAKMV